MATHILDEIFTYEKEAQEIVDNAKKSAQELYNHTKVTGERELSETIVLARKHREQVIEKAQKESDEIIREFEHTLNQKSDSDARMREKAKQVAHEMASLLLKTDLGED
jgi:vacuolar-type H+-ATPase subunit H